MSSNAPSLCSRCGSAVSTPYCGQCGLQAGAGDPTRRLVVIGALGIAAAAGLTTWKLVAGGGSGSTGAGLGRGSGGWESDWLSGVAGLKAGTEAQKSSQKPMLVYFYATWCGYCRRLDANILATAEARETLEDVIKVRINAEESRETMQLAGELGVRGYPTLMLVSPDGDLRRIRTPQTIDELRRLFA